MNQLRLTPEEFELLVWNITNEVLNGLVVSSFLERVGESKESFKEMTLSLRAAGPASFPALDVDKNPACFLRNALMLTLNELGTEEFYTRTGFEFEDAQRLLAKMDVFLSGRTNTRQISA